MFKKWCSRILLEIMGSIVTVLSVLVGVLAIVVGVLYICFYAIGFAVYRLFSLIRGGKHVRVD